MNYLAHLYLSGNNDSIKIGNFIADAVKGKKYKLYPENIQKGILLHRQIDSFTDSNDIVRQSKKRLNKRYGHYKGVIIDILFDHFLAKNWIKYSSTPLLNFTQSFYITLQNNYDMLPSKIQYLVPYLIKDDWLANYATLKGIEKVLIGMNKRTKEIAQMHLAINDLNENYDDFEEDFTVFFEKLCIFSALKLKEINKEFI